MRHWRAPCFMPAKKSKAWRRCGAPSRSIARPHRIAPALANACACLAGWRKPKRCCVRQSPANRPIRTTIACWRMCSGSAATRTAPSAVCRAGQSAQSLRRQPADGAGGATARRRAMPRANSGSLRTLFPSNRTTPRCMPASGRCWPATNRLQDAIAAFRKAVALAPELDRVSSSCSAIACFGWSSRRRRWPMPTRRRLAIPSSARAYAHLAHVPFA